MPPGEEACTDRDTALAMSAFPEWISGVRNQGQTKLCVSGPWGALSAVNYKKINTETLCARTGAGISGFSMLKNTQTQPCQKRKNPQKSARPNHAPQR